MDQLLQESMRDFNIVPTVVAIDVMFSILMASFFNVILAKFYIITHGGYSYSRSFVHSIVLVGLTIALIMVIIGSNIARAFALVGAMSIVRFRNPVKDSRDLVFVFAAIAIGMACGTQFYQYAAIFLFVFCLLLVSFKYFGFGDLAHLSYVVKLRIKKDKRASLNKVLKKYAAQHAIIAIEKMHEDDAEESIIFEFELKRKLTYDNFLDEIEEEVSPLSLSLLVGEGNISA
ncbi:MAG TPA: DUF4956 domain-containing protein [Rhodospirillales bacterium]|nr:DUF4956 domain-containing protein [Rhodospirillales bacterium]